MTTPTEPSTEAGLRLHALEHQRIGEPAEGETYCEELAAILAIEAEARATVPLDSDLLWEIVDKRWPHHVEGVGGTEGVRHSSWDVIDPGIPTREWLEEVAAEYARLTTEGEQT